MEKQKINQLKSEFFTLDELIKSSTAKKLKIDNTPNEEVLKNLQYGVDMVLDPLRRIIQKPIIITSGYRCEKLNKAVGGVSNSWHQQGNAADIHITDEEDARKIFEILKTLPSVDTILFEHSRTAQWIHVQWNMPRHPDIITTSTSKHHETDNHHTSSFNFLFLQYEQIFANR